MMGRSNNCGNGSTGTQSTKTLNRLIALCSNAPHGAQMRKNLFEAKKKHELRTSKAAIRDGTQGPDNCIQQSHSC